MTKFRTELHPVRVLDARDGDGDGDGDRIVRHLAGVAAGLLDDESIEAGAREPKG